MQPGIGIYTPSEAARLVGLHPDRVRRWVDGYSYRHAGSSRRSAPLFARDMPMIDGRIALSFLDLLEVLFVRAFLEQGVSLNTIRRAAEEASRVFGTSHPFTLKRFRTDGRRIFASFKDEKSVERLLELDHGGQLVLADVIETLLRQIEHDPETDQAMRWWPLGKDRLVFLDPARAMGAPIVKDHGVRTRVLYGACLAGESITAIAGWYEVSPQHVRDAISFEELRSTPPTVRAA